MTITSNTDWNSAIPGNLQFTNFTVNAGATLTVPHGTKIRCTGAASINGTIRVSPAQVYDPDGPGGTPAIFASVAQAVGITQTLLVDSRFDEGGVFNNPGLPFGRAALITDAPVLGGSTGDPGTFLAGAGGGTFSLRADGGISIGALGLIEANGSNGLVGDGVTTSNSGGGGGGGGGIIVLAWGGGTSFSNAGAIRANGGSGGVARRYGGGGGGGGIIRLIGPGAALTGVLEVNGGAAGEPATAPATGTGTNGGPGGTCGGFGGNNGFGNNGSYAPSGPGGTGHAIPTNVSDPDSYLNQ